MTNKGPEQNRMGVRASKRGNMKGIYIVFLMIFLSTTTYADTLLVGYDSSQYRSGCFLWTSGNMPNYTWKAFRVRAVATGTASYFMMRTNSANCAGDELGWGIYDDNAGSVGTLKAYGYYPNYDWTTIGAGIHKFNVTTVVTTASVVSGTNYWLVVKSKDISPQLSDCPGGEVSLQRGDGADDCHDDQMIMKGGSDTSYQIYNPPPPPSYYVSNVFTFCAWSVWQRSGPLDQTPPAAPTGLELFSR
jgi:hypothetical protein